MPHSVVTVGEFPNAMLAELARGRLQEEGIEAEVSGAMAQSWAGGEVPMSGVRLEVRREDAERARALLDEVEAHLREAAGRDDDGEAEARAEGTTDAVAAAAEPAGEWPLARTERAIHGALVVTLLSWVFLPLLALAIALVARVLIRCGPDRWTTRMKVVFAGTQVVAAALAAYALYLLNERPGYWYLPWPWFHTEPPTAPPGG
jgi:hypothetical protein